jgi:hypothetical protein
MSLIDEFDKGHKAYYDEVPRYKNPWSEKGHYDDSEFNAWERGWDTANEHHELFTENQRLQIECNVLDSEKEKYQEAIGMQETLLKITKDKMIDLGFKLDTISDLAHSLVGYINETNKLLFSREKMISKLKMMFRDYSPEVKKNKPK